jgi:hypothetical protein
MAERSEAGTGTGPVRDAVIAGGGDSGRGSAVRHDIRLRVYVVARSGVRADLPLVPPSGRGQCGVPGCACLEGRR